MVDIVITATNVIGAPSEHGVAGETLVAGKAVYRAATSKKWMLADSNSATPEVRQATGIALNGAALNQPVAVQKSGDITVGGTLVAGSSYYLSDTPGGICPDADVGAGEYVCLLGVAKSTSVLTLDVQFPNVSR